MKIRLLAFATAKDALGLGEVDLEVPAGTTVAALAEIVQGEYPDLASIWSRLAVAVDGELSQPEDRLRDGAEVALLPPVSGGAPRPRTALVEDAIDVAEVMDSMGDPAFGAVVLFLGTVRNRHDDRPVGSLTYEAYRSMAASKLESIAGDLEADSGRLRVRIVHRLGSVPAGEPSVAIAVASPHRAAAYEASRQALERLKREVPIWKLEHYADGPAEWREEESLA